MNDVILKIENLSKQYRLGLVGTGSLAHDINRWWHALRGKEDPYLQVGSASDRSAEATDKYVWALRDINLEVKQGEVLGIIGKNGAGKSTLLKILSRVTSPTTGRVLSKGRIASLLEVGTGFHPELTGRENIYLNGAILGMTKAEIKRKEEEIIEFSGCRMYIDTPVKRYSSGMRVRLGFAVAAFLDPDIMVVDEVLAVGDAAFQKKAIGKMQEVSTGEGRTVLFVSHNMVSVQKLCSRVVIMENGRVAFNGPTEEGISKYLRGDEGSDLKDYIEFEEVLEDVHLKDASLRKQNVPSTAYSYSDSIECTISYKLLKPFENLVFIMRLLDQTGAIVFTSWDIDCGIIRQEELEKFYTLKCIIPQKFLKKGKYFITLAAHVPRKKLVFIKERCLSFEIDELGYDKNSGRQGIILPELSWTIQDSSKN